MSDQLLRACSLLLSWNSSLGWQQLLVGCLLLFAVVSSVPEYDRSLLRKSQN